jgi:hypothetical protein
VTKPQLAPYAESRTRAGASSSRSTGGGNGGGAHGREVSYVPPVLPEPAPLGGTTPPAKFEVPSAPSTYAIPVYVDGKKVRTDIVRKPLESHD